MQASKGAEQAAMADDQRRRGEAALYCGYGSADTGGELVQCFAIGGFFTAIKGGAALVHGVQMRNVIDDVGM